MPIHNEKTYFSSFDEKTGKYIRIGKDKSGILKDASDDRRPFYERAAQARKTNAADKNEKNRIRFENAFNLCNNGNPPTVKQLAEYLDLEVRTARNWIKKYGYEIDKSTNSVVKIQGAE